MRFLLRNLILPEALHIIVCSDSPAHAELSATGTDAKLARRPLSRSMVFAVIMLVLHGGGCHFFLMIGPMLHVLRRVVL